MFGFKTRVRVLNMGSVMMWIVFSFVGERENSMRHFYKVDVFVR